MTIYAHSIILTDFKCALCFHVVKLVCFNWVDGVCINFNSIPIQRTNNISPCLKIVNDEGLYRGCPLIQKEHYK